MSILTDLFAKLGAWILTKFLTPKNVKKVIAMLLKKYVKNIKNDKKKDWQDTTILPLIESLIEALEK